MEIWPDGSSYDGSYANGMKHGNGKLEFADGSHYVGEFYENYIEGNGICEWLNGR